MAFGILLLVVAVSVVTWKMLNKHKCVQAETTGAEDRRGHLTTTPEPEVTYSTVTTKTNVPQQATGSEDEVTYSAVFKTGSSYRPSEDPADEVTYSSVILHNPQ
ncbi:hypothetical protein AAFF_G00118850 [Aldrovandia affinis]|uniref:Uncharacterized protein n=1 Tax=Aldrovandia affinis TaxID=143900 RepID=A0AAD7R1I0_9TELE|nr:hypothetical protein AAFF_G00118850 [Aldrovandia affinis]